MPLPVIEQIAARIKTVLGNVLTANGYSVTLGTVHRPPRLPFRVESLDDLEAVITQGDRERSEDNDLQGNPPAIAWMQPFEIAAIRKPTEATTTAIETNLNTLGADIEKALMSDAELEQMIVERHLQPAGQEVAGDGAYGVVTVNLEVIYRTSETDPYVNRAGS